MTAMDIPFAHLPDHREHTRQECADINWLNSGASTVVHLELAFDQAQTVASDMRQSPTSISFLWRECLAGLMDVAERLKFRYRTPAYMSVALLISRFAEHQSVFSHVVNTLVDAGFKSFKLSRRGTTLGLYPAGEAAAHMPDLWDLRDPISELKKKMKNFHEENGKIHSKIMFFRQIFFQKSIFLLRPKFQNCVLGPCRPCDLGKTPRGGGLPMS